MKYRHNYDRNDPYRGRDPTVNIVNYVSLEPEWEDELVFRKYLENELEIDVNLIPSIHIALCYSYAPIKGFPVTELTGEAYEDIDPKYYITLEPKDYKGYALFTDPYQNKHLVLKVSHGLIYTKVKYYINGGAVWDESILGKYHPFIIIEHNTPRLETFDLKVPEIPITFKKLHMMRFGDKLK